MTKFAFRAPITSEESAPEGYKKISTDFHDLIQLSEEKEVFYSTYAQGGPHWLTAVYNFALEIVVPAIVTGFLTKIGEKILDALIKGLKNIRKRLSNNEYIDHTCGEGILVPKLLINTQNVLYIINLEHFLNDDFKKTFVKLEEKIVELHPSIIHLSSSINIQSVTVELYWDNIQDIWRVDSITDPNSLLQEIGYQ